MDGSGGGRARPSARPILGDRGPVDEARRWLVLGGLAVLASPAAAGMPTVEILTRSGGRHRFTIEWARTVEEQAQGLMHRRHLPADHGMLFDLGGVRLAAFWMRDTPLSLDIVFVGADGRIVRIEERAEPYSEALISSGEPVRWVLEVLGGTAGRLGIGAGDRLLLPKG
jgi:uncharacterized membrane protein (UPF0127 family)